MLLFAHLLEKGSSEGEGPDMISLDAVVQVPTTAWNLESLMKFLKTGDLAQ